MVILVREEQFQKAESPMVLPPVIITLFNEKVNLLFVFYALPHRNKIPPHPIKDAAE